MSIVNRNPMSSVKVDPPTGVTEAWRLWRHCLCRYGAYPLLVAPIVTVGCLLEIYSSTSCEFIHVNVGFTPSNEAWSESTADLGLFMYKSSSQLDVGLKAAFNDGCASYTGNFNDFFITGDKTWLVSRIMAIIAGSAGLVAMITAWLLTLTPLPASFFWPGVLLPSVLISFLTGGAKFLLFDTQVCRGRLWSPVDDEETIASAESCSLSQSGHCAIAAACVNFVCVLLICLKAPVRRNLSSDYGKHTKYYQDVEGDTEGLRTERNHSMGQITDEMEGYITNVAEPRRLECPEELIMSNKQNMMYPRGQFNDEFVNEVDVEQPSPKVIATQAMVPYNAGMMYPMKSPSYSTHSVQSAKVRYSQSEINRAQRMMAQSMVMKQTDSDISSLKSYKSSKSAKSAPQLATDEHHGALVKSDMVVRYPDHMNMSVKRREREESVMRYPEYLNFPEAQKQGHDMRVPIGYKNPYQSQGGMEDIYPVKDVKPEEREESAGKIPSIIDKSEKREDSKNSDGSAGSFQGKESPGPVQEELVEERRESPSRKGHNLTDPTKIVKPPATICRVPSDSQQKSTDFSDITTTPPIKMTRPQMDEEEEEAQNDELIDKCVTDLRKSFGVGVPGDDSPYRAY